MEEKEIKNILSNYDIGDNLIYLKKIDGGLANRNYELKTELGSFLLKICDEKNLNLLRNQIFILNYLKKYGYFTSFPYSLKNKFDEFIYISHFNNEEKRIIIYNFLRGKPKQVSNITVESIHDLGIALAKLHIIPPPKEFFSEFEMGIVAIEPFINKIDESNKFKNHFFIKFLKLEIERLKPSINNSLLPKGIVHGDLFPDNALFENEKLIAIIDWEEVCFTQLILDIAMTIVGCCFPNNHLDKLLMETFLKAYNSIRPMLDIEWKLLDDFIDYASLSIAFWRFRQFNIISYNSNFTNKYEEMLERFQYRKNVEIYFNSVRK